MSARIVIADDHSLLRSGLRMLLDREPDFDVVGEASSGEEALQKALDLRPDVLLLDITMPGLSSAAVAERLKKELTALRIVVLTMHDNEGYLRAYLELGVSAYVVKKAADSDLCEAIRATLRGEVYVHPSLSSHLVTPFLNGGDRDQESGLALLTTRERTVSQLIARGHTNREIGERLAISVRTVESHRARVLRKLGLSTRAELVRFAAEHGLLNLDYPPDA